MIKIISMVLGLILLGICLSGLISPEAPAWLVWLNGIAGVVAIVIAGDATPEVPHSSRVGGCLAMAMGLYVLWVVGLAAHATAWMTWCTFACAGGFTALAIGASPEHEHKASLHFKKSA